MTQSKLAQKVGVSRDTISRWVKQSVEPDTNKVKRLSKVLGIKINKFYDPLEPIPDQYHNNISHIQEKFLHELEYEPLLAPRWITRAGALVWGSLFEADIRCHGYILDDGNVVIELKGNHDESQCSVYQIKGSAMGILIESVPRFGRSESCKLTSGYLKTFINFVKPLRKQKHDSYKPF